MNNNGLRVSSAQTLWRLGLSRAGCLSQQRSRAFLGNVCFTTHDITRGCIGGGAKAACDHSAERTTLPEEHAARLRAAPTAARDAQHVPAGVPCWHAWQVSSRGEACLNKAALLAPVEARTVFKVCMLKGLRASGRLNGSLA